MSRQLPISIIVMTYQEELNLPHCLSSVQDWAGEIHIVDSGSSDDTVKVAQQFTDFIHIHKPYMGAPQQWYWALQNVAPAHEWVLALDADHRVSPDLRNEFIRLFPPRSNVSGYYVRHKQIFMGQFLRHGGLYPRYRLPLFRANTVTVDDRDQVDNRFIVHGRTERIEFDLIEENAKERDLTFWIQKQVVYAERAAKEEFHRRRVGRYPHASLLGDRNRRVLWLRGRWDRLPLYWRSIGYFLYRYVFRLGFLDGKAGLIYHVTQGLLFRLMLDIELEKLRRQRPDKRQT